MPVIPDMDIVKALREERKTGEEAPSKNTSPPPVCFSIIIVDPVSGDKLINKMQHNDSDKKSRRRSTVKMSVLVLEKKY
jgi:hypothetical protein